MNIQDFSSSLSYDEGRLMIERCSVEQLAKEFSTPLFIYSQSHIVGQYEALKAAIAPSKCHIHYAIKANSHLAILRLLNRLGAGFDVVSGGELKRALVAGAKASDIMYSGVGKTRAELTFALSEGIGSINVESPDEVALCAEIAEEIGTEARIMVRVNPDVDAKTHPYISTGLKENKFGLSEQDALSALRFAHKHPRLKALGIACHIGSQLIDTTPFAAALDFMVSFTNTINNEGIDISHVDLGGGLGIRYQEDDPRVNLADYAAVIASARAALPDFNLSIEPGRYLVGNCGIFISQVLNIKQNGEKHFVIVDGAMNDVIRPALYQAEQTIVNTSVNTTASNIPKITADIVGPICESADFLAKNRSLSVQKNDYLALLSSGAYCASMSSNYNSRPRAAEVLVDEDDYRLITRRETIDDLLTREML